MKAVLAAVLLCFSSVAIAGSKPKPSETYWFDQNAAGDMSMSLDSFDQTVLGRLRQEACREANPPPECVTPNIEMMDVHINETIMIERPASSKQLDK